MVPHGGAGNPRDGRLLAPGPGTRVASPPPESSLTDLPWPIFPGGATAMRRRPTRPAGRDDTPGPRSIPIPKPGGGTRWLTVLDPADDAAYRASVGPLVGRI